MKNISYKLERGRGVNGDNTLISGDWPASSASFRCKFDKNTDNNSDSEFELIIDGGQVEKGEIKMCGPWERGEFIETLELILRELKD